MDKNSVLTLNSGTKMPRMGFGVFLVPPEETYRITMDAIECGYPAIDTAAIYGNEEGVGKAIKESGKRKELFITTKLWNANHGYKKTLAAFDESMEKLKIDFLDLYLIHWPGFNRNDRLETWRAMIELKEKGKIGAIGVSNFLIEHISDLILETGVAPSTNQIECHPMLSQNPILNYMNGRKITLTAWGPLMQGNVGEAPLLAEIGKRYGKSPQQVALRWNLQRDVIVIPKASSKEHMLQNLDVYDFELTDAEMKDIDDIDGDVHFAVRPESFVTGFTNNTPTIDKMFSEE